MSRPFSFVNGRTAAGVHRVNTLILLGRRFPSGNRGRRGEASGRSMVSRPQRQRQQQHQRAISHFSAGDCTERGRPVKALRCAPTAGAARKKRAALTNLPLRSCVLPANEKMRGAMGVGARRERQDSQRHHPLRLRRNERRTAEKHAASGERPGFVRCLSGLAFDIVSMVVRGGWRSSRGAGFRAARGTE